PITM
ncbi:cheW-like domain protein, partial [Vibrio parahaemolyticus V-223/04]